MDLQAAVEATYAAGTAALRQFGDGRLQAEGEVRFLGPAKRITLPPGDIVMLLDGDMWTWEAESGWERWNIGAEPRRTDGAGTLDMVAALRDVEALPDGRYRGRHAGDVSVAPAPSGAVTVELDEAGRVCRVSYPRTSGEHVVEFWDFGREVRIVAPEEYEVLDVRSMFREQRRTRFAGRNSPMRRRRRRIRARRR